MWPFQLVLAIYLLKVAGYWLFTLIRKPKKEQGAATRDLPSVDVVIPMFNEEEVVVKTIRNLLQVSYERFSIIVVDDGSTDRSFELVKEAFGDHPLVRLVHQPNGGKSSALNRGVSLSKSEIVVTIDADTCVKSSAIRNIVPYFRDERVAAVAGHIKVGNRNNVLTDMQYYEYVAIWDNDRAFSDRVNGILIVPGALAAYRRSSVNAVGGFKSEVIAEDTELTLRLLYHNYVLRNAGHAVAYTEAPDNLRMFFRQRVRWTTGLTQGLIKHNNRLFAHRNKWLSFLILPYTWLFRVILPFFIPLVDYYFLFSCLGLQRYEGVAWWGTMILTEGIITLYVLYRHEERVSVFRLFLLQRMYRHLLFFNYWIIFAKWINGTLFQWRKITRKGTVRLEGELPALRTERQSIKNTSI